MLNLSYLLPDSSHRPEALYTSPFSNRSPVSLPTPPYLGPSGTLISTPGFLFNPRDGPGTESHTHLRRRPVVTHLPSDLSTSLVRVSPPLLRGHSSEATSRTPGDRVSVRGLSPDQTPDGHESPTDLQLLRPTSPRAHRPSESWDVEIVVPVESRHFTPRPERHHRSGLPSGRQRRKDPDLLFRSGRTRTDPVSRPVILVLLNPHPLTPTPTTFWWGGLPLLSSLRWSQKRDGE